MNGVKPLERNGLSKEKMNWTAKASSFSLSKEKWFEAYKQLSNEKPHHVLLESGRGGQYSIIGLDPFAIVEGKGEVLTVKRGRETETKKGKLLDSLKEVMAPYRTAVLPDTPSFQGGAIGYLSYDIVREIEKLPHKSDDDLGLPDLYFMLFHDVFIYEHKEEKMWAIVHGEQDHISELEESLKHYEELWTKTSAETTWSYEAREANPGAGASMSEEEFGAAVEKIKEYIAAGDVFQVNLSVRQSKELRCEPMHVYETLRKLNPSPYMSYFETPDVQFVSASPELLVKKQGMEVSTRPIAGTRSRGKNEEEDRELAATLIENEKERAEHVMLVDLERNDLGRVCEYGTVEVNELMVIEKYSHVMHIVSNVRGMLNDQYDLYEVIRATFPGGTITGAPKVRTMEIIEELEPVRRGIYTGSIGWIGFNDEMELNITIRTMVCKEGQAHVQAGAGIVIDSNPKHEYKESLKKARALWHALELSEEELSSKLNS
ncbi:aminodeoxychorismate synthase, component I [Alkalihalophilus marmarensis]|uniref:Para-aminobenzoate synthase n=1 Tax=Alkalihalophilus marmarensis DSM 21297 TaxID=1188261 RepID=U6SRL4_9BACI|nr:para-aminobenzoate synthase [Alkalihalophilus marmarensis DSM 21297]